jgi:Protein of unknown function (DUF3107)
VRRSDPKGGGGYPGAERRSHVMEVRIGVVQTPKELALDYEGKVDDAVGAVERAITNGEPMVWFDDAKGRKIGVPLDKLAYIEVDAEEGNKRVGFGRI